jgi:hypothetical protein
VPKFQTPLLIPPVMPRARKLIQRGGKNLDYYISMKQISQQILPAGCRKRLFGATAQTSWEPGFATFQYPNLNRASTIWYHDHALGMTRLNVYAGLAGFYIIRGGPSGMTPCYRFR